MSMVRCEDCEVLIDSDYFVEVFRTELNDRIICDACWLNNYEECMDCEKIFPTSEMPRLLDPWGGDHGITGRCEKCEDNYDPTPDYSGEPPITDEERYQMAAKQKRELR